MSLLHTWGAGDLRCCAQRCGRVNEYLQLTLVQESGWNCDISAAGDKDCQKVRRAPISIRRGAPADTGRPKNGDAITPLNACAFR